MSYNTQNTNATKRTPFVKTSSGHALNYTGPKPSEGLSMSLALSVDADGNTIKSLDNNGTETVSFRNSFSDGDLFTYIPVDDIGTKKSVKLLVDSNGTKFASFTVQNTIIINEAGAKPASL